jgi:hypothetical protein
MRAQQEDKLYQFHAASPFQSPETPEMRPGNDQPGIKPWQ